MSLLNPKSWFKKAPLVPVLRLAGAIGVGSPFNPGLSLASLARQIDKAFSYKKARAIALQINSPGGSPVQSRLIYARIRALAEEKKLPIYVFIEDVAASGGYWLALAGDEIYGDESSIVGSIGVISAGFGFHEAIKKLGIERRVYTAGERKMTLDPFSPENPEEVERLKKLQSDVHESFCNMVRERRAGRLAGEEQDLFTGEFWSGKKGLDLGLIDGIGDLRSVMRDKFGENVELRLIEQKRGLWRRLGPAASGYGLPAASRNSLVAAALHPAAGLGEELIGAVETRSLWSRFGL
jgi:signal peptide peptidase SppA